MEVSLENEAEAHFLCAALNSSAARLLVKGYIALHPSPHVLKNIAIPRFDAQLDLHQKLAHLSERCHEKTLAGVPVADLEEQIDELAAELWGLTDEDNSAIRESLAILSPPRKKRRIDGAVRTIEEEAEEEKEDDT